MRVAVVGCGLTGSAAARYLAKAGHEVLLIGPEEPADKRTHRGVFASHYDEGRITRRLATDPFWATVSSASIDRYDQIASESGIAFYTPCGAMMAGRRGEAFIEAARQTRAAIAVDSETLSGAELAERFPFFTFPDQFDAFYEADGGGHISPRRLVQAQSVAAARHGAQRVPEVVKDIGETGDGVAIRTEQGTYAADAVLIATGAMTDHLAPRPLSQRVYARTVALFVVAEAEAARLASMPSLVFRLDGQAEPYLLPPIRYPDGRICLKLGGDPVDVQLDSSAAIGDWFRSGGNAEVRDFLDAMLRGLMPDLAIEEVLMDACVTTFTPSGRPVIDRISDRISVCSGGNGAGAKCSDELGRLGALVVSGGSDPLLQQTRFTEGVLT